ncbi:MAG: hypothetical protein HeimC3_39440 [Candidatus Heimdallarchaeota archaeon LC_3]|nr:MAG: hypothetical protein HeimC3_39440 [Candidatus Heimdallarchaeota archaeon LC_3]
MFSQLFQKSLKDLFSSLGPSLVGSTLLLIVFTLILPTLDSLILISVTTFIIALILNVINSFLLDFWVLSPKRVAKKSVQRIQNNILTRLESQKLPNNAKNKLKNHLNAIFQLATAKELKTLRYSKMTQNNDSSSLSEISSIQAKEIKINNFLAIINISFFILFLPSLLQIILESYFHISILPLEIPITNSLLLLPESFYSIFVFIGLIILVILGIGFNREMSSLHEMYVLVINHLIGTWQDFSFEVEKERDSIRNQKHKYRYETSVNTYNNMLKELTIKYDTSLRQELAMQKIFSENLPKLYKLVTDMKNLTEDQKNAIYQIFDQNYPFRYTEYDEEEIMDVLEDSNADSQSLQKSIDNLLTFDKWDVVFKVITDRKIPVQNREFFLKIMYNREYNFLQNISIERKRSLIRHYFYTIDNPKLREVLLSWLSVHSQDNQLVPLLLEQFRQLKQKATDDAKGSVIFNFNVRLLLLAVLQHSQSYSQLNSNFQNQNYIDLHNYASKLEVNPYTTPSSTFNLDLTDNKLLEHYFINIYNKEKNLFIKNFSNTFFNLFQRLWDNNSDNYTRIFKFYSFFTSKIILDQPTDTQVGTYLQQLRQLVNQDILVNDTSKTEILANIFMIISDNFQAYFFEHILNLISDNIDIELFNWVLIRYLKDRDDKISVLRNNLDINDISFPKINLVEPIEELIELKNIPATIPNFTIDLFQKIRRLTELFNNHRKIIRLLEISFLQDNGQFPNLDLYNHVFGIYNSLIQSIHDSGELSENNLSNMFYFVHLFVFMISENRNKNNSSIPQEEQVLGLLLESKNYLDKNDPLIDKIDELM